MPDSDAQTQLIKQAYKSGAIDPADTVFFEAHGTGVSNHSLAVVTTVAR